MYKVIRTVKEDRFPALGLDPCLLEDELDKVRAGLSCQKGQEGRCGSAVPGARLVGGGSELGRGPQKSPGTPSFLVKPRPPRRPERARGNVLPKPLPPRQVESLPEDELGPCSCPRNPRKHSQLSHFSRGFPEHPYCHM